MQSLVQVMECWYVPKSVVMVIEEYLDLTSLRAWRATNQQAFKDVEGRVRRLVYQMEQGRCIHFLQEPVGQLLGSAWFQFMTNVYQCKQCFQYDSSCVSSCNRLPYSTAEAEEEQLCGGCFMSSDLVEKCSKCGLLEHLQYQSQCYNCKRFWCEDCSDDYVDMCFDCTELFCDECRLDDLCLNCQ